MFLREGVSSGSGKRSSACFKRDWRSGKDALTMSVSVLLHWGKVFIQSPSFLRFSFHHGAPHNFYAPDMAV